MRRIKKVKTRFQSLEIWKSERETEFRVEGAVHAWFHRDRYLTGLAWDMIAAASLLGKSNPPRSILMLGLAGGTAFRILRHLLPDCQLTAVDIDEEIVDLAKEHMGMDELGVEVILGDAYAWLKANRRRFDVVIDDIYLAGITDVFRPQHCDVRMVRDLKRAMAPGGVLVVNLVTGPGHRAMQSSTRRCLREEFPVLRAIQSTEAQNEVLVAGAQVAGKRRLNEYASRFAHSRDRAHWQRMSQRRL